MEQNHRLEDIKSEELLIEYGDKVDEAIRKAVGNALREHRRAGNSVAVWRNGKVVVIEPENIVLDKI